MIYLKLLLTFFKIGLFSFGGGYAMIPMIEKEIALNGWITSGEFADLIAISEMTPGPIAVNSATYVGYKTAGVWGGLFATIGVALPSLLLIMVISHFFFQFQQKKWFQGMFYGIRPVIVGLIMGAAVFVAEASIFTGEISAAALPKAISDPLSFINIPSIAIAAACFLLLTRYKLHPILVIAASGAAGIILFYMGII